MSRIIYPNEFDEQVTLFNAIKDKHDAEGEASAIAPALTKYGIDLKASAKNKDAAVVEHKSHNKTSEQSEKFREKRDEIFDPVFSTFRKIVQFLKGLYLKNPRALADWGLKVDHESEIVYPASFALRVALIIGFFKYHGELETSPLIPYLAEHGIDPKQLVAAAKEALKNHQQFDALDKKSEEHKKSRDNLWMPIMKNVRLIGNYLKRFYSANPKRMGEWGFEVDDSPRQPREVKVTIPPASASTLRNLKNGTKLANIGSTELFLHKGIAIKEEGVQLLPDKSFDIVRGWGTTTVQNKSEAAEGKVSATFTM